MAHRTTSQANAIPQRPTTPLRTPSRTSFRASHSYTPAGSTSGGGHAIHPTLLSPLTTLEPAISELSDALIDLEANMTLLQQQHESIARFTENFAAFLYGLDMNAYCVDWVEAPGREAWARVARRKKDALLLQRMADVRLGVEKDDGQATPRAVRGRDVRDRTPRKAVNGAGNGSADMSVLSTTSARTTTSTATSSANTSIGRGRATARRSGIARGRGLTSRSGSRIASGSTGTASVSGFGYGSRPASVISSGTAAGGARENASGVGSRGRGVSRVSRGRGRAGLDGLTAGYAGRGRGRGGSLE